MTANIERLYGVDHGGKTTSEGLTLGDSIVIPSRELVQTLKDLPAEMVVGVEYHPDLALEVQVGNHTFAPDTSADKYWQTILAACQGKNIVFLEDMDIMQECMERVAKVVDVSQKLETFYKTRTDDPQRQQQLMLEYFTASVEDEYGFIVLREEALIRRIQETEPQVVVLGYAHADYLASFGERLPEEYGISVSEYSTDLPHRTPGDFSMSAILGFAPPPEYLARLRKNVQPHKDSLVEREAVVRSHRAVTEGRIIPNGHPAFIGTWDTRIRPRGLFEVYPNNGGFRGLIEDRFGTATFEGEVTGQTISFVKTYDPEKCAGTTHEVPASTPVEYRGISVDGISYSGSFRDQRGLAAGNFDLSRFGIAA